MENYTLHILNAEHGNIGYIPETMSVCRIHCGSNFYSCKVTNCLKGVTKFHETINEHLSHKQEMVRHYQTLLKDNA
jgi:hypothetical protein